MIVLIIYDESHDGRRSFVCLSLSLSLAPSIVEILNSLREIGYGTIKPRSRYTLYTSHSYTISLRKLSRINKSLPTIIAALSSRILSRIVIVLAENTSVRFKSEISA